MPGTWQIPFPIYSLAYNSQRVCNEHLTILLKRLFHIPCPLPLSPKKSKRVPANIPSRLFRQKCTPSSLISATMRYRLRQWFRPRQTTGAAQQSLRPGDLSLRLLLCRKRLYGPKWASPSLVPPSSDWIGETKYKALVNWVLEYIADFACSREAGHVCGVSSGMVNITPFGRDASNAERDKFQRYDEDHGIRTTMVEALKRQSPDLGLTDIVQCFSG